MHFVGGDVDFLHFAQNISEPVLLYTSVAFSYRPQRSRDTESHVCVSPGTSKYIHPCFSVLPFMTICSLPFLFWHSFWQIKISIEIGSLSVLQFLIIQLCPLTNSCGQFLIQVYAPKCFLRISVGKDRRGESPGKQGSATLITIPKVVSTYQYCFK